MRHFFLKKHSTSVSDAAGPGIITLRNTVLGGELVVWGEDHNLFFSWHNILHKIDTWCMLIYLNYSCFSESWENCLNLETFHRALHTMISEVMWSVNTRPYVLGITTKFAIWCFFNMLIILSCSFPNPAKGTIYVVKFNKNDIDDVVASFFFCYSNILCK